MLPDNLYVTCFFYFIVKLNEFPQYLDTQTSFKSPTLSLMQITATLKWQKWNSEAQHCISEHICINCLMFECKIATLPGEFGSVSRQPADLRNSGCQSSLGDASSGWPSQLTNQIRDKGQTSFNWPIRLTTALRPARADVVWVAWRLVHFNPNVIMSLV